MTTSNDSSAAGKLLPPYGRAADAAKYFSAKLRFQTDVADVHSALQSGKPEFVLIDTRGEAAWLQGRIPGAIHLPTREIASRARAEVSLDRPIVTYCWGPGCDGATRGALEFAMLRYRVKEMIGGFEYWVREGFPIQTDSGVNRHQVDQLVAARFGGAGCGC